MAILGSTIGVNCWRQSILRLLMTGQSQSPLPLTYLLLPTLALETRCSGTPTFESIGGLAAAHCEIFPGSYKNLAKQQLREDEVESFNTCKEAFRW